MAAYSLITLNMSFNSLDDASATAFAAALPDAHALKHLDLSHNRISTAGATELAQGMGNCNTLKTLKVGFNPLGYQGTRALIDALVKNTSINELRLENTLATPLEPEEVTSPCPHRARRNGSPLIV